MKPDTLSLKKTRQLHSHAYTQGVALTYKAGFLLSRLGAKLLFASCKLKISLMYNAENMAGSLLAVEHKYMSHAAWLLLMRSTLPIWLESR